MSQPRIEVLSRQHWRALPWSYIPALALKIYFTNKKMSLEMYKHLKKKLDFSIRNKGHNIMNSTQMCRVMYIH